MSNLIEDYWGNGKWYDDEQGLLHREDGPAFEGSDGLKSWYFHGKLHREDGPAIERSDGTKEWFLNGKQLNKELYEKLTRGPLEDLPKYIGQGFDEFIGSRLKNE
jgi:hypothetical protein